MPITALNDKKEKPASDRPALKRNDRVLGKHVQRTFGVTYGVSAVLWLRLSRVLLLLLVASLALPLLLLPMPLLRRLSLVLRTTSTSTTATAVLHGDDIRAAFKRLVEVADVAGHVLVAGDGKGDDGLAAGELH